jgi:hypothetical protein
MRLGPLTESDVLGTVIFPSDGLHDLFCGGRVLADHIRPGIRNA